MSGATVLYRKRDVEKLVSRLKGLGHSVKPLNFNVGSDTVDFDVYHPGVESIHTKETHLKLGLERYVTLSFDLIVTKAK